MDPDRYGITLHPADLKLLGAAFDEAWEVVAAELAQSDTADVAAARARLATIVLELAKLHQLGPDEIKTTSLRIFRVHKSEVADPIGSAAAP